MTLTPWWECLSLRPEIARAGGNINDVQMSLFSAVHEQEQTEYADVAYYSDITHPTKGLLELMGSIAVRLAAPTHPDTVKPVWRGDQGMGGGKSHAQVGLFHMANSPDTFFNTDLGKQVLEAAEQIGGEALPTDLGSPAVVVLPCDRMDPFQPDKKLDNIADTLGQRWLWRLVGGDLEAFHAHADDLGTPDGIKRAMAAVGRPVLTLVDEVLNYIRKATAHSDQQDRAQQDMAFLRDLMDATNTSEHAALVVVMIASDVDQVAMADFGERIRSEMEAMLTRYGRTIATTSGGDFAEIIRRRLFTAPPPADVIDDTVAEFQRHVTAGWAEQFNSFNWWTDGFARKVERAYPFHPALVDLVEREWANRAGFQKVRSTIQIFAAAVHAWLQRAGADGWAPPLIGLGDLPLSDTKVRESLLNSGVIPDQRTVTNYREIAANDVVDSDGERGSARRIDIDRSEGKLIESNPRVAERIATCMYVCSLAPRTQGAVGATEAELRVAGFVADPSCDLAEIDAVLTTLESPDKGIATLDVKPGKGGQPRRLLMSTTQTLQMFFRTQRQSVTSEDTAKVLRDEAQAEMSKGPFGKVRFVNAEGHVEEGAKGEALTNGLVAAIEAAGVDEAETRLIILDPSYYTLLNGVDSETRMAIWAAIGLDAPEGAKSDQPWPSPMSVVYASSCVFAVVNTYRRNHAVAAATDYVAWQRVSEISNVSSDESLLEQAQSHIREKKEAVRINLRKAYQHIVYLGESREAVPVRLDKDNQTALDGTLVWKTLAEREKTFAQGEFDKTALLFQLREADYGKSLASIRADFYRSPRLPLLYDGDTDLKNVLYAAQQAGEVVILNSSGQPTQAARPGDINVNSSGLTLERPVPDTDTAGQEPATYEPGTELPGTPGPDAPGGTATAPTTTGSATSPATPTTLTSGAVGPAEQRVVMSLMGSAFNDRNEQDAAYRLFTVLANALDNGQVSFGKFQIEVTLPASIAEQLEGAANELGVNVSRSDI